MYAFPLCFFFHMGRLNTTPSSLTFHSTANAVWEWATMFWGRNECEASGNWNRMLDAATCLFLHHYTTLYDTSDIGCVCVFFSSVGFVPLLHPTSSHHRGRCFGCYDFCKFLLHLHKLLSVFNARALPLFRPVHFDSSYLHGSWTFVCPRVRHQKPLGLVLLVRWEKKYRKIRLRLLRSWWCSSRSRKVTGWQKTVALVNLSLLMFYVFRRRF